MKMNSIFASMILTIALLFTASARAQTATPPPSTIPAPSLFTISGNIGGLSRGSSTNTAEIASAAIQTTTNLSLGYEHISVPSASARWELGIAAYSRPLSDLLGSKLTSKLLVNTSSIGVTFTAGAGKVLEPTANRVAETAGVHISYPLMDGISLQLVGVDVLHGAGHTQLMTVNTTTNVSTGINIYFGHR